MDASQIRSKINWYQEAVRIDKRKLEEAKKKVDTYKRELDTLKRNLADSERKVPELTKSLEYNERIVREYEEDLHRLETAKTKKPGY